MRLVSALIVVGLILAVAFSVAYFTLSGEAEPLDCGRNQSCVTNALLDCVPATGVLVKEPITQAQEYEPSEEDVSYIEVHGKKILLNWSEKSQEYDARAFELGVRIEGRTDDGCMAEFVLDGRRVACALPSGIEDAEEFEDILYSSYMQRCTAK